jgi:hypothetical protein
VGATGTRRWRPVWARGWIGGFIPVGGMPTAGRAGSVRRISPNGLPGSAASPGYGLARDGQAPDAGLLGDRGWLCDENWVDRYERKCKAWQITSLLWWRLLWWRLDPGPSGLCRRDRDSCTRRLQQHACLLHGPKQSPERRQRARQPDRQQRGQRLGIAGPEGSYRRHHTGQLGQERLPEPDQRHHLVSQRAEELGRGLAVESLGSKRPRGHSSCIQREEVGDELQERHQFAVRLTGTCRAGAGWRGDRR